MPNNTIPVRSLGVAGIIRDVEPYNLPLTAFSSGNNVRFQDGAVRRAPAFRVLDDALGVDPNFMLGVRPADGSDFLVLVGDDGSMYRWSLGVVTDITPPSFTPIAVPSSRFTGTFLDQTAYINRPSDVPYALLPGASSAVPLTDYGWGTTWRARALRSFRDSLVALSMEEDGIAIPGRVRISDAVTGQAAPPVSWDANDLTNTAFSTELPDIAGTLLDGLTLRDDFYVYSTAEVWRITPIGGRLPYSIKKVFGDRGILATGLVVEANGSHIVVGENDIYIHDGTSERSIVDGINRDAIFESMRKDQRHRFWLHHDTIREEVMFAYISDEADAAFPGTEYPNRYAVYDLNNGTWSFGDLPNVPMATTIIYFPGTTWDNWDETWDTSGGTWDGSSDQARTVVVMASRADTSGRLRGDYLYGYDWISDGSVVPGPLDTSVVPSAYVERISYDLDEIGHSLRDYIRIQRIYPQAMVFGEGASIQFRVGAQLNPQGPDDGPFQANVVYDPRTQYKIDFRRGGRYFSIRVEVDDPVDFLFSGMDVQYTVTGRR